MQLAVLLKNKKLQGFFFLFSEQVLNQEFGRKEIAENMEVVLSAADDSRTFSSSLSSVN